MHDGRRVGRAVVVVLPWRQANTLARRAGRMWPYSHKGLPIEGYVQQVPFEGRRPARGGPALSAARRRVQLDGLPIGGDAPCYNGSISSRRSSVTR